MTVILGIIDSNEENSISGIFSDNIEFKEDSSKIMDKILMIDNRYLLGFLGLGLVKCVVDLWIKYFENYQRLNKSYTTIYKLAEDIEIGINTCISYWKNKEIIDHEYIQKHNNHPSSIIVLDRETNNLYYLELGGILEKNCQIMVKKLRKGYLYEFGVSATEKGKDYLAKKNTYFDKEILLQFIKNHIRELHSKYNEVGWLLGSYYLKYNDETVFYSCYRDRKDILKNLFCRCSLKDN